MACPALCRLKHVIEQWRAEFIARYLTDMLHIKFFRCFCGSFIIAKQNDFTTRMQERPTSDGVSLDKTDVSRERFGDSK